MINNANKPLITIGVSCFNAEATIKGALNSAIAQTWNRKEIVVVDDCSTDNTLEIVKKYYFRYPNLIRLYCHNVNEGVASVRNTIIQRSLGKYIAFFDDDDTSHHDRLENQYNVLKKFDDDKLTVCYTARTQRFANGMEQYMPPLGTRQGIAGKEIAMRILTGKPFQYSKGTCATCSQMAPRNVYEVLNGFDPSLKRSEDTDFNVRLSLLGGIFIGEPRPLVHQNVTLTSDKNIYIEKECWMMIIKKHKDVLGSESSYSFCLRWSELKYDFFLGNWMALAKNMLLILSKNPLRCMERSWWALSGAKYNLIYKRFQVSK